MHLDALVNAHSRNGEMNQGCRLFIALAKVARVENETKNYFGINGLLI